MGVNIQKYPTFCISATERIRNKRKTTSIFLHRFLRGLFISLVDIFHALFLFFA